MSTDGLAVPLPKRRRRSSRSGLSSDCGHLQDGYTETEIGAVRNSKFGGATIYEQLVALDDQNHIL